MSFKNLTESEIVTVVELIKQKRPYRDILKEYPSLKSTSTITKIKIQHIDIQEPKIRSMSERSKRKISKQARQRYIGKKSEIIIDGYINILKGLEINITNLEKIEKSHAEKIPELIKELNQLKKFLKNLIESGKIDQLKLGEKLEEVSKIATKANNLFLHSDIRIKAIAELRRQFETFARLKVDAEVLSEIGKIIVAFITGCDSLDDTDYYKYKKAVINYNELTLGWFEKYEGRTKDKQNVVEIEQI